MDEEDDFMDEVHRMCFGNENRFEEELNEMIANQQVEPLEEISDELEALLSYDVNESGQEKPQEQSSEKKSSPNVVQGVKNSEINANAAVSLKKPINQSEPSEPSQVKFPESRVQIASKPCVRHIRNSEVSVKVVELQRRYQAYRVAAYQANQIADKPWAFRLLGRAHKMAVFKETLEKGQNLDVRRIPPPPKLNPLLVGPVQMGIKCSPAMLLGLQLSTTQSDVQRLEIYKQILEEQRIEASVLASQQKQIGLKARAEELEQLARNSETMLRALGSTDPACVQASAQFYAVKLLVPNRTLACKENQLQIAVSWLITHCNTESTRPWMATFVEVELPFPLEVKRFRTNESVVSGNNSRGHHIGMFRINTGSWYHTRCVKLQVKVYCRVQIGDESSEEPIDSHVISMRDLEESATMVFSDTLKGQKGALEITISQYRPLNGSALTILTKPWLSLYVEPADQIEEKLTNTEDQTTAPVTGPAACKHEKKQVKNESNSSNPTLRRKNGSETMENSTTPFQEHTASELQPTPASARPTSVQSVYISPHSKGTGMGKQHNDIPRSTLNMESSSMKKAGQFDQTTYSRSSLAIDSDKRAAGCSNVRKNPVFQHQLAGPMTEILKPSQTNMYKQDLVSRQLLKDQEQMHFIRSSDPGLLESVRFQHQRDLVVIRQQIRQLDERFSGPNGKDEMKRYVSELEQLKANLEAACKRAKQVNNLPYLAGEQHKLDVVTDELKMIRSKL
ncbi:hypothetical protein EG68_05971 [Paragonimus skrjabini miyazakii]|uniref:Uncharacterized protein n=1 Tax=Paragonimus skrjabini miyazakii TaxID=59628 RepID=A0A8S9YQS9_9TREM|nr:hypothetical protein EG68_05971 [Paragonimus skrjabini miyazakii]